VFFSVDFVSIGGKGNYYFLSNMNRAPAECELGANGDQKKYKLELHLIAHFGLVNNFIFP
jgi:GTP-binding protein